MWGPTTSSRYGLIAACGATVGVSVAIGVPAAAAPGDPQPAPSPTESAAITSGPVDPFDPTLTRAATVPTTGASAIAVTQQRLSALEARSAQAASRVAKSAADMAASQQRLELFTSHVATAKTELAKDQRTLERLARELYLAGGVDDAVLTFSLEDPDRFIADLDRVAVVGTRQNTVLERTRTRALSMRATQLAAEREQQRLAGLQELHRREQSAAQQALTDVTAELKRLQVAEEQRVAQEEAKAALARAIAEAEAVAEEWRRITANAAETAAKAAAALTGPAFPAANPAPAQPPSTPDAGTSPQAGDLTEDLSRYGDSASWAASAKSQSVIMCESGGDYTINTGNGYYGAWQFDYPSWHDNGGGTFAEYPHQATRAQQDYVAWTYWLKAGWRPWECG